MALTESLLKKIQENDPSFVALDLSHKKVGDDNVKELSEALKNNRTLTSLNLNDNKIEAGAKDLIKVIKYIRTLISLNLRNNKIGDLGAIKLSQVLRHNTNLTTLNLRCINISIVAIRNLSAALMDNKTLTSLNLRNNKIRSAGAIELGMALKENKYLTSLNLGNNKIGKAGAQALSNALQNNITLSTLKLKCNKIRDGGVTALSQALKKNTTLIFLELQWNKISDAGLQELSEGLQTNNTLSFLDLGYNNFGDASMQALSDVLTNNKALTALSLRENLIGDTGINTLCQGLKNNKTLTTLDLGWNMMGDSGARALSQALQNNSTLTSLHLEHYHIANQGKASLTQGLATNFTILVLQGVAEPKLTKFLERNKALAQLINSFKTYYAEELGFLIDIKTIEEHLKQLVQWVQSYDISPEAGDNEHILPNELFRLLYGLQHIAHYQANDQVSALCDALQYLIIPPFENTALLEEADSAFNTFIHALYECSINEEVINNQTILLTILLYSLKNKLEEPDARIMAYAAIGRLEKNLEPSASQLLSVADLQELPEDLALLSYQDILSITKKALECCHNREDNPGDEIVLLSEALTQKEYHPLVIECLFASPAFVAIFKEHYKQQTCALVESSLLTTALHQKSKFKISVPQQPQNHSSSMVAVYKKEAEAFPLTLVSTDSLIALKKHEMEFNGLLAKLKQANEGLEVNKKNEPKKYCNIAEQIKLLHGQLAEEGNYFFNLPTAERFALFKLNCYKAITGAELEVKGPSDLSLIIRGILGVLEALDNIPGLVEPTLSRRKYNISFFTTPQNYTHQQPSGNKFKFG